MKFKQIARTIERKVESWLKSLPDDLATKIEDNILVSGGSIVSMMTGEKVNDYDIYFTTRESALAVADYYASLFTKINGYPIAVYTKERVFEKLRGYIAELTLDGRILIDTDDGDTLLEKTEKAASFKYKDETQKHYRPSCISPYAITLNKESKIQLIIRFFGEPEEILQNFDFIHVQSYWLSSDPKNIHTTPEILEHIMNKRLKYIGSKYPVSTLFRTRKYIRKEYFCPASVYLKAAMQISELNLTDPVVFADQVTGVDLMILSSIIHRMRKELAEQSGDDHNFMQRILEIIDEEFDEA